MRSIRPSALIAELKSNALAGQPSMIWGAPGVGKTQITQAVANAIDAKLYDLRANLFDPVDVRGGLKVVEQEDGTYRTRYGVPEDYPDPDYEGNVLLDIEELPAAPKATMNAFLQLVLDKRIGSYHLPKNTVIVATGNRAQDRAAVHEMPTPLKNRFAHYTLEPNIDDWAAWAHKNGIDTSIIAFLRFRPMLLNDIDPTANAFPTPRAWEMLSNKLPYTADEFYGAASVVGDGAAGEYLMFKKIYKELPDIDKLLANPSTTAVPKDPSVLYAIAGALPSRINDQTVSAIMKYTRRMPVDFQVVIVRDCIATQPSLITNPSMDTWMQENADVLL